MARPRWSGHFFIPTIVGYRSGVVSIDDRAKQVLESTVGQAVPDTTKLKAGHVRHSLTYFATEHFF